MISMMCLLFSAQVATGYFPLEAGLSWEYAVSSGYQKYKQVIRTLEPTKIGEVNVVPLVSTIDGGSQEVTYYRLSDNYYCLVAVDQKELLPVPIPFLPQHPKRGFKWTFEGQTPILGGFANIITKSEVVGSEEVSVMGEKVTSIKIFSESTIGSGDTALKVSSSEWYVDGVGLIKRVQQVKNRAGGTTETVLVRFSGRKI
jgi:hypothetical protein